MLSRTDIICLGLLWCNSDNFNRAQILFELLSPVTKSSNADRVGLKDHEMLTAVLSVIVELSIHSLVVAYCG